ncbi:NgoBV family restriction endonuclease [Rheinheimera sp. D18]|uniref:NgoBV family restriction endonuclease n=1 Tax=Rheinheimera sp. D18 TaxID=2545632 RepID=UPI0010513708|nr:NgoBV family restriction endonuclease [Rheinheimera sp. D18]QBL10453.1 NgoBV family restriction endonuclease [Rheinheimera sp. D18]
MYHKISQLAFELLLSEKPLLVGGTKFKIANIEIDVEGKDGLGGLIEEWFGLWSHAKGLAVYNPKALGNSQTFPDYYVGDNQEGLLEIKSFDIDASANFDIANFESYCESLSFNPARIDSDYLIFGYSMTGNVLTIKEIWLKKIWEITCPSARWPLKTQTKRDQIYNIRPAAWYSNRAQFLPFSNKEQFVDALYSTQKKYLSLSESLEEIRYRASKID